MVLVGGCGCVVGLAPVVGCGCGGLLKLWWLVSVVMVGGGSL